MANPPRWAVLPIGRLTNSPITIRGTIATIGTSQKGNSTGRAIFLVQGLNEKIVKIEMKM